MDRLVPDMSAAWERAAWADLDRWLRANPGRDDEDRWDCDGGAEDPDWWHDEGLLGPDLTLENGGKAA